MVRTLISNVHVAVRMLSHSYLKSRLDNIKEAFTKAKVCVTHQSSAICDFLTRLFVHK